MIAAAPSLKDKMLERIGNRRPRTYYEIVRICNLPLLRPVTDEEHEEFCRRELLSEAYARGERLFRTQTEAVLAYDECDGVFGPIGVGWGKTLISLMVARRGLRKGISKVLLLVPAQVYPQLVRRDISWARMRVPLNISFILMGERSRKDRIALARTGRSGCYILPYSCLSTEDTVEVLELLNPGLVIADECHKLKNLKAARSGRLFRKVLWVDPKPEFVCLSGTITSKSLRDYHHLIVTSLRQSAPVPIEKVQAGDWACVVDSNAQPTRAQTGPLLPLLEWAIDNYPEETIPFGQAGFRHAYRLRLRSTPGVVATGDGEIGTSLRLHNEPAETEGTPGWEDLVELVRKVDKEWLTPNGDEIEHKIHSFKWLFELTAGFYNELYWPTPAELAKKQGIDEKAAEKLLVHAKAVHELHEEYARELRTWLNDHARDGLDTPRLVGLNLAQHGAKQVGQVLFSAWRAWKNEQDDELPERWRRAIRVCPFKMFAARRWVEALTKEHPGRGGIIWYYNKEVGEWLTETLDPVRKTIHCKAGKQFTEAILHEAETAENIVVASLEAHGTGKNLQTFEHQLYVQWPRSAILAEQSIGRTHRPGQQADELQVDRMATTDFDNLVLAACLNDALYIHQTTGNPQKLIYCDWDPLPKVFPSGVLRERGLQPKMLSREQQSKLKEKFGT